MSQVITLKSIRKWHLILIWPATFSVLLYILSALAHPVAGWLAPHAINHAAPAMHSNIETVESIAKIISLNQLVQAKVAKLVPFKEQTLLQITQLGSPVKRYFSSSDYSELKGHDEKQAIWLARHYAGSDLKVRSLQLIKDFNSEYSASNRLLPVYKVDFNTQDNLSVVIDTESMALVSISNTWKRTFKGIFRNFHAFDWLNDFEILRVLLITALLVLMLLMSITGFYYLILLKRNKTIAKTDRRWHRRLAYVVVLPLFLFSISGFYHLFHNSLSTDSTQYFQLSENNLQLNLQSWNQPLKLSAQLSQQDIVQVSLISEATPMYRLSIAKDNNGEHKRQSSKTVFLDAASGEVLELKDKQLLQKRANTIFNLKGHDILNSQFVSHFGTGYSFKNKILPVWEVAINDESQTHLFIDPISQKVVSHNTMYSRAEAMSFSGVHMYGWLKPIMDHGERNMVFTVLLTISLILSVLGLTLYLTNKKRRSNTALSSLKQLSI